MKMPDQDSQPTQPEPTPKTQPTQPRGIDPKTGEPYEGIEIPVPHEADVMGLLEKMAKTPDPDRHQEV